jgi:ABC-type cobalamin/Fe3+-siderophores transport system ATPase subunit
MLRRNLFAYLKTKGITCIVALMITDALSYADQTIVLQNGTLIDKAILSIYTIIN